MAKASVSTHVLDTTKGAPAAGVRVRLETQRDAKVVGTATTDAEGRIRELGHDLEPGVYRIVFETREYMKDAFFAQITLDVTLADGHTHVPLLLSRFGVTSYRGS
jgi:5-hydroxyisourate hydrolase